MLKNQYSCRKRTPMSTINDDPKIRHYAEQMCSLANEELYHIARGTFLNTVKPFDASDHIQGRLLSMLSKIMRPSLIVELGTFTGYGTYCLAEGLATDGKILTVEQDALRIDFINMMIKPIAHKVELINDTALNAIDQIRGPVDILFIDAGKREYMDYYELMLGKMCPGGLIIADNVLWKGEVTHEKKSNMALALDEFNRTVAKDLRVEVVLLPYRDGLSMIRVK